MTRKFISKDDLLKYLPTPHGEAECDYHERIIEIIYDMDTISIDDGLEENKDGKAKWEECNEGWICSGCSHTSRYAFFECPYCGKTMINGTTNPIRDQ